MFRSRSLIYCRPTFSANLIDPVSRFTGMNAGLNLVLPELAGGAVRSGISSSQSGVSLHPPLEASQRRLEVSLIAIFVLTLPLLNPWVRGDGVGYYGYARAPLIERKLDFTHDYQFANESFREAHCDENGNPKPEYRTSTGHLENHFTVGPAMLWSPFLVVAHAA